MSIEFSMIENQVSVVPDLSNKNLGGTVDLSNYVPYTGATANQIIKIRSVVNTNSPTMTYNGSSQLTGISYPNSVSKSFTYNANGTMNVFTTTLPDASTVVKTMVYTGELLTSIITV